MELDYKGFQKSRLIELADEIYKCKGEKQQLELELASEEFHKSYIPKRKKMMEGRIKTALPFAIILLLLLIFSVTIIVYYIINSASIRENTAEGMGFDPANAAMGIGALAAMLVIAFGGFLLIKISGQQLPMLVRFYHSFSPERAMRFAKKHGINTFQDDEVRCNERIAILNEEIKALNEKIASFEKEQEELIEKAKNKEAILKKYDIIKDIPQESQEHGDKISFKLKEPEIGSGDITELYDYYSKEESFTNYIIEDIKIKISNIDKEIIMIDSDFEKMKKKVIIFGCILIFVAIIQNAFSGFLAYASAAICLIIGLVAAFSLERFCYAPTIRYLVEHEHPIMTEYTFVNNIVPARRRKDELVKRLSQHEEELEDIKKRKKLLDL